MKAFLFFIWFKQFINADARVTTGGEGVKQLAKTRMKFVRAPRAAAEMEHENETIQAVWVFAFALEDAVEDGLGRNEVGLTLMSGIQTGKRAWCWGDDRHAFIA